MRILIVDESRATRLLARGALEELERTDLEILEADDGFQALDILKKESLKIDVLLVDWNIPRMNLVTFLKKVTVLFPVREIPVIVLADDAHAAEVPLALRWGAADTLLRPFTAETLQDRIAAVMRTRATGPGQETSTMLRAIVSASQVGVEGAFMTQLPVELADRLHKAASPRRFRSGGILIKPGQRVEAFQFILQGAVQIVRAEGGPPELRGIGDAIGERAFLSAEVAQITATAQRDGELAFIPHGTFGELVQQHRELSFYLGNLLARRPPAPKQAAGSAFNTELSGNLGTVSLPDLVQVLCMTRKTGLLNLSLQGKVAGIYFVEGEIHHAWIEKTEGEAAFTRIVGESRGAFIFDSGRPTPKRTIEMPAMNLLMEAARLQDEGRRPDGG